MDLTLDLWTAAFFAATTYDSESDTYTAITDTTKHPYGALYLYNEIPIPFRESPRINVVGMQPLSRPGRQSAFVFKMYPKENFNVLVLKTYFRHDAEVNKEIVSRVNKDNNLFPKELIGTRIRNEIVKGDEFSSWAYNEAKRRYAQDKSDDELKAYLEARHITSVLQTGSGLQKRKRKMQLITGRPISRNCSAGYVSAGHTKDRFGLLMKKRKTI